MADTIREAWLNVQFTDEGENVTNRRVQLDTASGVLVTILAAAAALVNDLKAATDSAVSDYTLQISYDLETPATAQTGAEIENTAQIAYPLVVSSPTQLQEFGIVNIPAPKIGMFVSSSGKNKNVVDMADSLVTNLAANFQSGGGCYLSHGGVVASSLASGSGRRVHRRSAKG